MNRALSNLHIRIHKGDLWHWSVLTTWLLITLVILGGCQTPESLPTPTPTRTPIIPTPTPTLTPSPTPTAIPTNTPTPTPTLPPNLVLPPSPQIVTDWSAIPANLYFLRNGRINIWLTEGSHIEIPLLSEDRSAQIHSYDVTPGGRYILYLTSTGKLYRLDRATWEHTPLAISGYLIEHNTALYDISSDGEYVYYLAWGTQPSSASSPHSSTPSGTILGVNTQKLQMRQIVVGFCQGSNDIPCLDIALSPDERQLAYSDGLGIWLAPLNEYNPIFLAPHGEGDPYSELSWSTDGRWLLFTYGGSRIMLYDTAAVEQAPLTLKLCENPCKVTHKWASNTLWLIIHKASQSCIIEINPYDVNAEALNSQLISGNTLCQVDTANYRPLALQADQDGRLFFLNRRCDDPCTGPTSGIYVRDIDGTINPIAIFDFIDGTMSLTPDGSAFLFENASNTTRLIGLLNDPAYWDVTNLLKNAVDFQWDDVISVSE